LPAKMQNFATRCLPEQCLQLQNWTQPIYCIHKQRRHFGSFMFNINVLNISWEIVDCLLELVFAISLTFLITSLYILKRRHHKMVVTIFTIFSWSEAQGQPPIDVLNNSWELVDCVDHIMRSSLRVYDNITFLFLFLCWYTYIDEAAILLWD
jgi:hypothetical protein